MTFYDHIPFQYIILKYWTIIMFSRRDKCAVFPSHKSSRNISSSTISRCVYALPELIDAKII